jgi:pyridoxal phosphate enzyme (YggS family)
LLKFGENKIQEAEQKYEKHKDRKKIELHFIGKLQSNKIKKAVKLFDVIQTIENKKQIIKIDQHAKKRNKKQQIYIQINISEDPKKGGVLPKEVEGLCNTIQNHKNTQLRGVMTVLKQGLTPKQSRGFYKKTKEIQKETQKKIPSCEHVSMGMSGDYKEAIKAGATEVRLGTILFGQR